ncbi:phosphonate metabolism protein PhnM [Bradyrhizobium sp. PMVTL-01]|uniref:phosphonate metabolism protein PhnM n=1 Tax=Bradyrhizobium sp. PMVTL-01 TaxID=3434999 RepID=UPI003F6FB42D
MRTFLIILGIWLLINVLFVVIMMPPRKPRKPDHPRSSAGLAPAAIEPNAYPFDEDEKVSFRHTIIAIAMGALFSLTPPLLQAIDDIKRLVSKYRKSGEPPEAENGEGPLETVSEDVGMREERMTAGESSSDDRNAPKR